eukprot:4328166-Prymnesium_polylepis.1
MPLWGQRVHSSQTRCWVSQGGGRVWTCHPHNTDWRHATPHWHFQQACSDTIATESPPPTP